MCSCVGVSFHTAYSVQQVLFSLFNSLHGSPAHKYNTKYEVIKEYQVELPHQRRVAIVDFPSIASESIDDQIKAIKAAVQYLASQCAFPFKFLSLSSQSQNRHAAQRRAIAAIVCRDISKAILTADDVLNIKYAKDLIGPGFYSHTTVLTIGWEGGSYLAAPPTSLASHTPATHGFSQREAELKRRPEIADILQGQGQVKRFGVFAADDRTRNVVDVHEPLSLVEDIWKNAASAGNLLVQDEFCVEKKSLDMTKVGAALDQRISKKIEETEEECREMDEEMSRDLPPEQMTEIMDEINQLEAQIKSWSTWSAGVFKPPRVQT